MSVNVLQVHMLRGKCVHKNFRHLHSMCMYVCMYVRMVLMINDTVNRHLYIHVINDWATIKYKNMYSK